MNNQSSRSLVILLHEIYGVNGHINHYKNKWISEGFDVLSPNFLNRAFYSYEEEQSAYQYFMNNVGFHHALQQVNQLISSNRRKYDLIFLLGFSIGATIAWLASENDADGVIGFYGTRIRDYEEVEPKCRTLLFFSSMEQSLDPKELGRKLEKKQRTKVEIIDAGHGFMNPFFKNYNQADAKRCTEESVRFFKNIEEAAIPRDFQ